MFTATSMCKQLVFLNFSVLHLLYVSKRLVILTRILTVKNDKKTASSEHLHCSMVILFLKRLSNPLMDISAVVITENCYLKKMITDQPTNQDIFQHISQATYYIH
jgi:hypothetical protein